MLLLWACKIMVGGLADYLVCALSCYLVIERCGSIDSFRHLSVIHTVKENMQ